MTHPEQSRPDAASAVDRASDRAVDRADADRYLALVRAELDDLSPQTRDDLLEDLPGHLHEASADSGQPLERVLGTPQAYAAELRSSAGVPPRPTAGWDAAPSVRPGVRLGEAAARRVRELTDRARRTSQGRAVLDFVPQLRPAWWVLRGYLVLAVPAAMGVLFGIGVPPFLTLFGSDLLGLLAVVAAVVVSVRLGQRSDGLPSSQRQLVVLGNTGVVALSMLAGLALADRVSYDGGVVHAASESGFLQGPDGGISNLHPFDAQGRPLRDVQLFDQDGRPIDTLLLEAPDGSYAEPVRALDENGAEVRNVFPRTLVAETWGPQGEPTTAPVPPPAIVPRRLATADPTPDPTSTPVPTSSPGPTAGPTVAPTTGPAASSPPGPLAPAPPR